MTIGNLWGSKSRFRVNPWYHLWRQNTMKVVSKKSRLKVRINPYKYCIIYHVYIYTVYPSQGYQDIAPVASFNIFFEFFSAQQLKFEVKSHSPICIRFEHVSTTSLSPGIGAVIWQPHLHALSSTSSSSFSMASWSSWSAQAPCNQEMRWCGLVKFYLKLMRVMSNNLLTLCPW